MSKHARYSVASVGVALAASLIAPALTQPVAAQEVTQIFSSGSYFTAPALRDQLDCYGIPVPSTNPRLASCPTPVQNIQIFYAGTGSGAGINNFVNQNSNDAGGLFTLPPFADPTTGVTNYPYVRPNGGIVPDFVSTAALLTSIQDGAYARLVRPTRGKYLRLPTVVGPLAMPYSPALNSSGTRLPAVLNLTRQQYCSIWAGEVVNWSQLTLLNADGTVAGPGPNLPVIRVVRADDSGGTYGFTNHLSQACRDLNADGVLDAGSTYPFTAPFQERTGWVRTEYPGFSFIFTANGAPRTVRAVLDTPGAIGYVSASVVQPDLPDGPPAAALQNYFSVNSVSLGGSAYQFQLPTVANAREALRSSTQTATLSTQLRDSKISNAYPITIPGYTLLYCKYDAMGVPNVPPGIGHALKELFNWTLAADPDGIPETADDPVADKLAVGQVYVPLTNALKQEARRALDTVDTHKCTGNGPFGPS